MNNTNNKLTQEDKNLLIESIKAAKNSRTYVVGDEPGCVVGQIAVRLGVTVPQLKNWGNVTYAELQQYPVEGMELVWPFAEKLPKSLHTIQGAWDFNPRSSPPEEVEQTRTNLLNLVSSW